MTEINSVSLQQVQTTNHQEKKLLSKAERRTTELQKFIPQPGFIDSFKGNLKYASKYHDWGFNLPFRLQEASNLFTGAIAATMALPVVSIHLIAQSVLSPCHYLRGKEDSFDSLKQAAQNMGLATKLILVGVPLGISKVAIGLITDTFKLGLYGARSVYSYFHPERKRICLVLIDIQNDFFDEGVVGEQHYEKGNLAVKDACQILSPVNALLSAKKTSLLGNSVLVAASKDWHPANHGSFASQHGVDPFSWVPLNGIKKENGEGAQKAWPDHCIQGTKGAEFAPGLLTDKIDLTVTKGEDDRVDSYSALNDNGGVKTKFGAHLKAEQIDTLIFTGLATDYCVKFSAEDALRAGYDVVMVEDAMKGIGDHHAEETRQYLTAVAKEMKKSVQFLTKEQVIKQFPDHFKAGT